MWIVTNKGFLSVVKDDKVQDNFIIRARNKEAYDGFFDQKRIYYTPKRDYAYRVFGRISEVKDLLKFIASKIDYNNFKNSIEEDDLHTMAAQIWSSSYRFQEARKPQLPKKDFRKPVNAIGNLQIKKPVSLSWPSGDFKFELGKTT